MRACTNGGGGRPSGGAGIGHAVQIIIILLEQGRGRLESVHERGGGSRPSGGAGAGIGHARAILQHAQRCTHRLGRRSGACDDLHRERPEASGWRGSVLLRRMGRWWTCGEAAGRVAEQGRRGAHVYSSSHCAREIDEDPCDPYVFPRVPSEVGRLIVSGPPTARGERARHLHRRGPRAPPMRRVTGLRRAWHRAFSQRRVLAQPAPESHPHIMAAGEVTPGLAASEYAERCAAERGVVLSQPPQHTNAHCAGELPSQTFCQTDRWLSSQRRHSRICRTTCHFHVRKNIAAGPTLGRFCLMHHRLPHRPSRCRPALPVRVSRARVASGLCQVRTARCTTVAPIFEANLPDKGAVGRPTRRGRGGAALLSGRRRNARHCSGRRCLASRAAARTERALPRARQSGRGRGSQTTACSVRRRGCAATPPRRDAHAADTRRASTACVAQSAASRRGTPGCSRRGSGSRRAPPSRA